MRYVLCALLLQSLLALCGATQTAASEHIVTTIPFHLIGNHIYVQALVNGTGPYRFIVDTGGVNLVTPALQAALHLPALGNETGHGVGPKAVDSGVTELRDLMLGGHAFGTERFFVFDLEQLFASGGVHMSGMVGFEVFKHFVTRIDFGTNRIELIEPQSFGADPDAMRVPLMLSGNEMSIPASFDGAAGRFQLDTGSGSTLTLASSFVEANKLTSRFPHGLTMIGGGVGGTTHEYTVRGRNLRIGEETIAHPVVQFSLNDRPGSTQSRFSGNIGIGALKRFVMTFDFQHGWIYLERPPITPEDLDTYDRSGLTLSAAADGFRVENVVAKSPAAESGIHAGDLVTTLDGKPASDVSLPDIREALRDRPAGTSVLIGLKTQRGVRNVRIKLRDLL